MHVQNLKSKFLDMEELGIKIEPTTEPVTPTKKTLDESDYYTRFQELKKQIEFYDVQEEYIKGPVFLDYISEF